MDPEYKASLVHGIFSSVASKYDLMNDLMSGGLHRLWKNHMIKQLPLKEGAVMLDVAGGTGDIAFRTKELAQKKHIHMDYTLCDINHEMLKEGKKRSIDNNAFEGFHWVCGNAEQLPVADRSVDIYTIAFGIRNVSHIDSALAEAYRVLKPGGKFVCMEFSHIDQEILSKLYDLYSLKMIPKIGKMVTGNEDAYTYLVESIRAFPKREVFSSMIEAAEFSQIDCEVLTGGVVAIHSGWRV